MIQVKKFKRKPYVEPYKHILQATMEWQLFLALASNNTTDFSAQDKHVFLKIISDVQTASCREYKQLQMSGRLLGENLLFSVFYDFEILSNFHINCEFVRHQSLLYYMNRCTNFRANELLR